MRQPTRRDRRRPPAATVALPVGQGRGPAGPARPAGVSRLGAHRDHLMPTGSRRCATSTTSTRRPRCQERARTRWDYVGQLRIVGLDPAEQLPGPGRPAGPLVQVGEGVGAAQMVRPGPRRQAPAVLQDADRRGQVSPVGLGAGQDDAPLGDQIGRRRRRAELLPQGLHVGPAAQGTVAVGQHRMLLHRPAQLAEVLELSHGFLEPAQPVQHQAVELAHVGDVRSIAGQPDEQREGLLEPLGPERLGRVVEAPHRAPAPLGTQDAPQLGAGIRRVVRRRRQRRPLAGLAPTRCRPRATRGVALAGHRPSLPAPPGHAGLRELAAQRTHSVQNAANSGRRAGMPEGPGSVSGGLLMGEIRRRPTLPGRLHPSTIGAGGLNFRVRNGNGCDPAAIATETLLSCGRTPKQGNAS